MSAQPTVPYFWRPGLLAIGAMAWFHLVWLGSQALRQMYYPAAPYDWRSFVLMPAVQLAPTVVVAVLWRRSFRRIKRCRYEVCLHCGYCLSGLEHRGKCPECAGEYDLTHVQRKWRGLS